MLLLALASPLWSAAIVGLPQPPTPAPMPLFWIAFQDDLLGDAVLNTDDFRTGGLRMASRIDIWDPSYGSRSGRPWYRKLDLVVAVDYAVLTDRGRGEAPESRCDETTSTAGVVWDEAEWPFASLRVLLAAGGGVRIAGDLGGQTVQNEIHRTFGYRTVLFPYAGEESLAELGYAYFRATWDICALPVGHLGLQPEAGGLMTSHHERQSFAALKLAVLGTHGSAWMGGRYQAHSDQAQSATAHVVAEHERGWWLDAGIGIAPGRATGQWGSWGLWMDAAVNPQTRAIDGSVGLMCGLGSGYVPSTIPREKDLVEPVAIYSWNNGYGLRLRLPLTPAWMGGCGALAFDYRHGGVGMHEWQDCEVDYNQWTVGLEPAVKFRHNHWPVAVRLFAHGDAGLRVEALTEKGESPRFTADHASAAVLTCGSGVALTWDWRGKSPSNSDQDGVLSLWLGYDWWFPLRQVEISNGDDSDKYLKRGNSLLIGVGVTVAF